MSKLFSPVLVFALGFFAALAANNIGTADNVKALSANDPSVPMCAPASVEATETTSTQTDDVVETPFDFLLPPTFITTTETPVVEITSTPTIVTITETPVVTETPVIVPTITTPDPTKDNCNNGAGNGDNCTPGNSTGNNNGSGKKDGDQDGDKNKK